MDQCVKSVHLGPTNPKRATMTVLPVQWVPWSKQQEKSVLNVVCDYFLSREGLYVFYINSPLSYLCWINHRCFIHSQRKCFLTVYFVPLQMYAMWVMDGLLLTTGVSHVGWDITRTKRVTSHALHARLGALGTKRVRDAPACLPGRFAGDSGSTTCGTCPENHYTVDGIRCLNCTGTVISDGTDCGELHFSAYT